MIVLEVILLLVSGVLWISSQSIKKRSLRMEDEAHFSGATASGMSGAESQSDSEEDESLLQADIQTLNSYARVLKTAAIVLLAVTVLILIGTSL